MLDRLNFAPSRRAVLKAGGAALAAAGMPLTTLPQGNYPLQQIAGPPKSKPQFMQVTVSGMA